MNLFKVIGGAALVVVGTVTSPFVVGLAVAAGGGLLVSSGLDDDSPGFSCCGAPPQPDQVPRRRTSTPPLFRLDVHHGHITGFAGTVLAAAVSAANDVLAGSAASGTITCREKDGIRRLRFSGAIDDSLKQRLRNVLLTA